MLRPNGGHRRILEEVSWGPVTDWLWITVEKCANWDSPSLFIHLSRGIWLSAGLFWRAITEGCSVVNRRDQRVVVVDLLDDGRLRAIKYLDGGSEVHVVLNAGMVAEIQEALQELRERYPRPRRNRHPAMAAEAAS